MALVQIQFQPIRAAGLPLQKTHVFFVNKTNRTINLYWINYQNEQTFYITLQHNQGAKVNTFGGHAWIFRDRVTGEYMQVAQQNIFQPKPYIRPDPARPGRMQPFRAVVIIHFPVRSLRQNGIWAVLSSMSWLHESPGDIKKAIHELCIPHTLKSDLLAVFNNSYFNSH